VLWSGWVPIHPVLDGAGQRTWGGLPPGPDTLMALVRPSGLVSVSYSTVSPSRKDLKPSDEMLLCTGGRWVGGAHTLTLRSEMGDEAYPLHARAHPTP